MIRAISSRGNSARCGLQVFNETGALPFLTASATAILGPPFAGGAATGACMRHALGLAPAAEWRPFHHAPAAWQPGGAGEAQL